MTYLKQFLMRHKGKTALAVLLLLAQVVCTLLIPALVADIVDRGILRGDMAAVLRIGGWMLAVTVLSTGVAAWGSWVTSDLASLFGFEMRSRLLRKSQQLSLQQFDAVGISSMITRTTSDIINLQRTMGMVLQMVVPAPILVGGSIVMTTLVSPVMAAIQLIFMAVLLVLTAVILKKQTPSPQHPDKLDRHQPGGAGDRHRRAGHPRFRQRGL